MPGCRRRCCWTSSGASITATPTSCRPACRSTGGWAWDAGRKSGAPRSRLAPRTPAPTRCSRCPRCWLKWSSWSWKGTRPWTSWICWRAWRGRGRHSSLSRTTSPRCCLAAGWLGTCAAGGPAPVAPLRGAGLPFLTRRRAAPMQTDDDGLIPAYNAPHRCPAPGPIRTTGSGPVLGAKPRLPELQLAGLGPGRRPAEVRACRGGFVCLQAPSRALVRMHSGPSWGEG